MARASSQHQEKIGWLFLSLGIVMVGYRAYLSLAGGELSFGSVPLWTSAILFIVFGATFIKRGKAAR